MEKYVKSLADDERTLEEKIKRKSLEIERANKRLKSMSSVKPAFVEELERNEKELERLYVVYLEKFRNLDWLEHEVDKYNDLEYQRKE
jgi:clusterin-associated protein 1